MISANSSKAAGSQSKSRPGTPAYWIFVVGLVVSICIFWYWGMVAHRSGRSMAIGLALLIFVPCVVGPFCRALGWNVAAAACASVVAGSSWTVIFFLVFVNARESLGGLLLGLFYVWELFLPVLAIALATTDSLNKRLGPGWTLGTVGAGLLCGAIGANAAVASKEAGPTGPDPLIFTPNMVTINKCTQEFAASNPEKGYPESLGQLGPEGSGCVPEALLAGQVKGFTITYEPSARDANGRISGYKVVAREAAPVGKNIRSIFTDESGLIRIRSDGPHGKGITWEAPTLSSALRGVLDCVLQVANGGYRINDVLISDEDQVMRVCERGAVLKGKRKLSVAGFDYEYHKPIEGGYDFEYKLDARKNGKLTGFTVEARPRPYGVAGVRSYLAVENVDLTVGGYYVLKTLNVYVTPEDRPATVNDPLARASEVGLEGYIGLARLCIECAGDATHSGSADQK